MQVSLVEAADAELFVQPDDTFVKVIEHLADLLRVVGELSGEGTGVHGQMSVRVQGLKELLQSALRAAGVCCKHLAFADN
ncbi:hypothetical protein MASR1M42_13340 [Azonexus hydrophilus]